METSLPQLRLLAQTDNTRSIQTILHNTTTSKSDFEFHANRLIRLVVEEGLDKLPLSDAAIVTPTGESFAGKKFTQGICGVTIMQSGSAMEHGLRECCKSIHIGHILIQHDESHAHPQVYYAKLPDDAGKRLILLLSPIIYSGQTTIKAIEVLQEFGVPESSIRILNLFATPSGVKSVIDKHPNIQIVSSEVSEYCCSMHFESRYFGT
eukprot:m.67921 g.67921  ORF g.67921 m.67921 type:complete len:208 (+) comp7472_c0_seq3:34-657(+)